MLTVVPQSALPTAKQDLAQDLGEGLAALMEFLGARAGWIGLIDGNGLAFPVRLGDFPDAWLTLQQGASPRSLAVGEKGKGDGAGLAGLWGFGIGEEPTLLNDLPSLPGLGEPSLRNLISCPLMRKGVACGQLVAANKPHGFTSYDAAVLQASAHWMSYRLARREAAPAEEPPTASYLPRNALDRIGEGVFVLDDAGRLVWANAVWQRWTGFSLEELVGRTAPFPFWVSHRVLALLDHRGELSAFRSVDQLPQAARPMPFRRRDDSVFWCDTEVATEELEGHRFVLAILHQTALPAPPSSLLPSAGERSVGASRYGMPAALPFAAVLTDGAGRILWANEGFFQHIAPTAVVPGTCLHEQFRGLSAESLHRLTAQGSDGGRVGRIVVQPAGHDKAQPLVAYWSTLSMPDGPGFFFGFCDDWAALGLIDDWAVNISPEFRLPGSDCLALLLSEGHEVDSWSDRWLRRTGLSEDDLAGVPMEVVFDWLFPRQRDRERVADLLHHADGSGGQMLLDLACPHGSQPALCTFLPFPHPEGRQWLLLADDPSAPSAEGGLPAAPLTSFLRGLGHLLNHYVLVPQSLAETALDSSDLSPDIASAFEQILDRCQSIGRFLAVLQDLAAAQPAVIEDVSLPDLVREFLSDIRVGEDPSAYELDVDLPGAGFLVRANRRMIKTVLYNLFTNARQALLPDEPGRIRVRVFAQAESVGCSITDNGEGLPNEDWMHLLAPFASTKGPFARDARHAAMDAAGLGLSVSRHLLALHGGRLELRPQPNGGTSALFFLPRAGAVAQASREPLEPVTVQSAPSQIAQENAP